jgi:hypothetical protein
MDVADIRLAQSIHAAEGAVRGRCCLPAATPLAALCFGGAHDVVVRALSAAVLAPHGEWWGRGLLESLLITY